MAHCGAVTQERRGRFARERETRDTSGDATNKAVAHREESKRCCVTRRAQRSRFAVIRP